MSRRMLGAAALTALVALGCQSVAENMAVPEDQLREARYGLQATLAGVTATASTTESSYYAAAKVVDGNLVTAWAPAPGDASPTLYLELGASTVVDAVSIKLSPAAQVTIAAWTGSAWLNIATDLAPTPTVLTRLDLPNTTTTRLRLTFSDVAAADLLVCETVVDGTTPTPTPRPPCQCKVTGGGYVYELGPNDSKVTFGLVAMEDPKRASGAKGTIQVTDHATKRKYHGSVNGIVCDNNNMTVTFTGTLRGGGTFTTVVTDYDEPGRDDAFAFRTSTGFAITGLLGDDDGGGGNIQVHRDQCP